METKHISSGNSTEQVIHIDGAEYSLGEVLGQGATSVVCLAANLKDENDKVAVKIAKDTEDSANSLIKEYETLRKLESEEKSTSYFPRVKFLENEGKFLGIEYIETPGVHDCLMNYPGLRFPEPLALDIAHQYADMLAILHSAGLTCGDRKLSDLHWDEKNMLKKENVKDFKQWQKPDYTAGSLKVLDWNVTDKAKSDTIARDLFHFGVLWHRMILGVEPRVHKTQLEEPLERHNAWETLSYGTRMILQKLLNPEPGKRYLDAEALRGDLEAQIKVWKKDGSEELIPLIRGIYEQYISEKSPSLKECGQAMAQADVLRIRAKDWKDTGTWKQVIERYCRTLRMALRPFRKLEPLIHLGNWDQAKKQIELLEKEINTPADLLELKRQAKIVSHAEKNNYKYSEAESLFKESEYIYNFDQLSLRELAGKAIDKTLLAQWKNSEKNEGWKTIRKQFYLEAEYRLKLSEAKDFKDTGDYERAKKDFSDVCELRDMINKDDIKLLNDIYGDPVTHIEDLEGRKRNLDEPVRKALLAIKRNDLELEAAFKSLEIERRSDPDDQLLRDLYHFLEMEKEYRLQELNSEEEIYLKEEIYLPKILWFKSEYLEKMMKTWMALSDNRLDRDLKSGIVTVLKERKKKIKEMKDASWGIEYRKECLITDYLYSL